MIAGVIIGAGTIQALHAQAKPPAYVVIEADVKNQEGFAKQYIPLALKALRGGSFSLATAKQLPSMVSHPKNGS